MPYELLEIHEAVDTFIKYMEREAYRIVEMYPGKEEEAYHVEAEPTSNLYSKGCTLIYHGILNAKDPIEAAASFKLTVYWHPEGMLVVSHLLQVLGGEFLAGILRGGGLYPKDFPGKKIKKIRKSPRELIEHGLELYTRPWWEKFGRPAYIRLLEKELKKSLENLDRAAVQPSLIVGEKPEDTGTGLLPPYNTRGMLRTRFRSAYPMLRALVESWYHDLIEVVKSWPQRGGRIIVGGDFKGTPLAGRSDVDIKAAEFQSEYAVEECEGTTRKVGTTPASCSHNKELDDDKYQLELWTEVLMGAPRQIHFLPQAADGYKAIMSHRPATSDPSPEFGGLEEFVTVDIDFGYRRKKDEVINGRLELRPEDYACGADNLFLLGVLFTAASTGKLFMMLESGAPETMIGYIIAFGYALSDFAERHSIPMWVLQVGDDCHILIQRKNLELLNAELGQWMRSKGMYHIPGVLDAYFILGTMVVHLPGNRVLAFTIPRGLKSVTSAVKIEKDLLPKELLEDIADLGQPKKDHPYEMPGSDEAYRTIQDLYRNHGEIIMFDGSLAQWEAYLDDRFLKDKIALWKTSGTSSWMEFIGYEEDAITGEITISLDTTPFLHTAPPKSQWKKGDDKPAITASTLIKAGGSQMTEKSSAPTGAEQTTTAATPEVKGPLAGAATQSTEPAGETEEEQTSKAPVPEEKMKEEPKHEPKSEGELIEILRNPENKAVRASYKYKGLLAVVKVFDPEGDDNFSVKLYNKPETYEKVKSFWKTVEKIEAQSPEFEGFKKQADEYLAKILGMVRT